MKSNKIRVLIFEDKRSGGWSAQGLDYDIATQAKTLPDLCYEVQRMIVGHLVVSKELQVEPFVYLKAAPPKYWQMFDQAKICLVREPAPFGPLDASAPLLVPDLRMAELQLINYTSD